MLRRGRYVGKIKNHMGLKDILPLDVLLGGAEQESHAPRKKKKKVDREALASPMMRIPRMDVRSARDLIDVGIRELYQLQGRSPETLFEDARAKKPKIPDHRLPYFRMAVYFAENEDHDPEKLQPSYWMD